MNKNRRNAACLLTTIALVGMVVILNMSAPATVAVSQEVKSGDPQTLLFVQTTPDGAEVRLGGKVLGESDGLFPVEPGTYKIVIDLSGHEPREQQITIRKGRIKRIELSFDGKPSAQQAARRHAPRVVATNPPAGATDVDPNLKYISVAFDQDMQQGFSFTGGGPEFPKVPQGERPTWKDRQTCVLPVRLEKGRYYRVGINSTSYQNFRSSAGLPVPPSAVFFTTQGASQALKNQVRLPKVVSMTPENGAQDVDPSVAEIRVVFDVPMGGGFSWTGGGPTFPQIPGGKKPSWSSDGKTCTLPVELKPGWDYVLGLNSVSHKNFQSKWGVPLKPMVYQFSTRAE